MGTLDTLSFLFVSGVFPGLGEFPHTHTLYSAGFSRGTLHRFSRLCLWPVLPFQGFVQIWSPLISLDSLFHLLNSGSLLASNRVPPYCVPPCCVTTQKLPNSQRQELSLRLNERKCMVSSCLWSSSQLYKDWIVTLYLFKRNFLVPRFINLSKVFFLLGVHLSCFCTREQFVKLCPPGPSALSFGATAIIKRVLFFWDLRCSHCPASCFSNYILKSGWDSEQLVWCFYNNSLGQSLLRIFFFLFKSWSS